MAAFRHSIRWKLTSVLIITLLSILAVVTSINMTFAESFYYEYEQNNIIESFYKINKLFNSNLTDEELNQKIGQVIQNSSIRIVVGEENYSFYAYKILYSNAFEKDEIFATTSTYMKKLNNYLVFGNDEDAGMMLEEIETKGYVVTEIREYVKQKGDLSLFGLLDNGYFIVMQIPMESMKSTVTVFTRFLSYITMMGVIFGGMVMFFVSRSFTKPIKEMANVAQRMRELDFDAKVSNITPDELGDLGICINDLSAKLEQTISELKTANNELRKDIDQRTKIDDMRKEFLSHVSHELKTPIALIQGYAEGLKENISDDEESREFYCEVITDEADKMNKMVKKLLTLNEIEFGQDKVHIERFDVVDLLKNLTGSTSILFQKKNVALEFDYKDPIYVWADEFMIEEVLSNYISNALNHVKEGGLVRIRLEQKGKNVRIYVYNTGEQIPEEDIDKIWIKFFKVDKARTREYGGSGIGLSIVAATMEAHGKAYGVRNVEDGVEFYIDLDTNL